MPTAITTSTDIRRDARQATVYVREHWSDEWTEIKYLWADSVTWCANPSVSHAKLSWNYGLIQNQDEIGCGLVSPKSLDRWFVKIVVKQSAGVDAKWYGLIEENAVAPDGAIFATGPDDVRSPSGRQALLAYGLEILLDRETINSAVYQKPDGTTVERIGRALSFNPPVHHKNQGEKELGGNRSYSRTDGVYLFIGHTDVSIAWSTRDAVEYLLKHHAPGVESGAAAIEWKLDDDAKKYLPDWDRPKLNLAGRTVKDALDALMSRHGLLGYRVDVASGAGAGDADVATIRPFTFSDTTIVCNDGNVVANADQKTLDFDAAIDVTQAVVKRSCSQTYDQVVARGSQVICCGTFSPATDIFERGWTVEQAQAYNAGASGEDDYSGLEDYEKQRRNNQARESDRFERVFSHFVIPDTWDGKILSGGSIYDLFPATELESGSIGAWYWPELRVARALPLKTDHDYSGSKIADDTVVDSTPEGQQWALRRPLVVLKLPEDATRYGQVEKLASAADIESLGSGGRHHAYGVRMLDDEPGIEIKCHGAPQHALAKTDFSPCDATDQYLGEFDWQTDLLATLALEADYRVQVAYPGSPAEGDRTLAIDLGDRAQCHYVAPHTLVDLDDGLPVYSDGGFIRDDRELLEDAARIAYQWYCFPRQSLTLTWRQADLLGMHVGDLIVEIGKTLTLETIRTVITELTIQFADSANSVETCTLQTQWAELDVLRLL